MPQHTQLSEVTAPRSQFYQGPYGRMFRNLPPHVPTFDLINPFAANFSRNEISQAKKDTEEGREVILKLLAKTMVEKPDDGDNPNIPAGYTYFLQFITHDITFDPTSSLMRFNDPDKLQNFRTPRLDLDSLYGGGPENSPFMYFDPQYAYSIKHSRYNCLDDQTLNDPNLRYFLLVGLGQNIKEDDLPRNSYGRALIGDPRNDENIMISQLHLGFIKFHNRIMERLRLAANLDAKQTFRKAQQLVRWHYQWVILHDFLPRFVDDKILEEILGSNDYFSRPNLCYYRWRNQPFIPVEFAMAAFRFGHSMIRNKYQLNSTVTMPILHPNGHSEPTADLRGFSYLPTEWTIQWNLFLDHNHAKFQPSRQINTHLSRNLGNLSSGLGKEENRSLATLDLLRGFRMELPSGQAVARAMGLERKDIVDADGPELPLWYYILREAEEKRKGYKLGPVGGRIVAEVIIGLLVGDPFSFINVDPWWHPKFKPAENPFRLYGHKNPFRLPKVDPYTLMNILVP